MQGQAGEGDDWSQLPLHGALLAVLAGLGHGKGAAGLPEVMLRQGQRPLGHAALDGAKQLPNPCSISCFGEGNSTGQKRFCWGQDHRAWLKACERQPLAARQLLAQRQLFPVQHLGQPGMYWGSSAGGAASLLPAPAAPRIPASICAAGSRTTRQALSLCLESA